LGRSVTEKKSHELENFLKDIFVLEVMPLGRDKFVSSANVQVAVRIETEIHLGCFTTNCCWQLLPPGVHISSYT